MNTFLRAAALPVVAVLLLSGCSGASGQGESASGIASGAGSEESAEPTTAPTTSTAVPAEIPTNVVTPAPRSSDQDAALDEGDMSADRLEPVSLDQAVLLDSGVTVALGTLSRQDVQSPAAADPSGAGLIVPVTVANTTGEQIELSGLVVTIAVGGDGAPAQESLSASDEIPSTLAPGAAVTIRRAFVLPVAAAGALSVVVDMGASSRAAVFTAELPSS